MPSDYPPTAVPFQIMPLAALRDPVLAGPGIDGLGTAATTYRDLADLLEKAAGDLRVALRSGQDGHEGVTAEAARQFVDRVAAAGELGAGQARIVIDALDDSAAYYARARDDMNALSEVEKGYGSWVPPDVDAEIEEDRILAVEASDRYERNSNYTLGRVFQLFDVPLVDNPDAGTPVALAGAGAGGAGGFGAVGGLGATGGISGTASGSPLAAGGAFPGVGGTGIGPGGGGVGGSGAGGSGVPGTGPGGLGPDGRGGVGPVPSGAVPGGGGLGGGGLGGAGSGGVGGGSVPGRPGAGGVVPVATGPGRGGRRPASLAPASESPVNGRYPVTGFDADGRPVAGGAGGRPDPSAATSSGWVPGQPWSSRNPTGGGTGGFASVDEPRAGQGGNRPSPPTGTPVTGAPARGGGGGATGMPFFPGGAGAGRGQDGTHPRPEWLLEDDPQAFWLGNLPPHGPAVIGGTEDQT